MRSGEQEGHGTIEGVVDQIQADAMMLMATLPREAQLPFMGGLACMLAATRHTKLALEVQGYREPELIALCNAVALAIVGKMRQTDDVPDAFRCAFADE